MAPRRARYPRVTEISIAPGRGTARRPTGAFGLTLGEVALIVFTDSIGCCIQHFRIPDRKREKMIDFAAEKMIELGDKDLFGSETADTENPDELDKYFVGLKEFDPFTTKNKKFGIVRAKKGVGKSALLKHVLFLSKERGEIASFETGSSLLESGSVQGESPNEILLSWQIHISHILCKRIAQNLYSIRTTTEMAIIRKHRPLDDEKSIKSIFGNLKIEVPFISTVEASEFSDLELVRNYMQKSAKEFWLIVDDIDATYRPSGRERETLSQFFTAARLLASEIPNLFIRCSVRRDVWTTIARDDEALDKCEQDVTDIRWSQSGTFSIIKNRLNNYIQKKANDSGLSDQARQLISAKPAAGFNAVFPDRLPWGKGAMQTHVVLHRLSAGRPRWALQLCKMAAAEAVKVKAKQKITTGLVRQVLPSYSRFRIGDIVKEHRHQCENIEDLIMAFDSHKPEMDTSDVLERINEKILKFEKFREVNIDGRKISNPQEIAHFLFRIDFIEARSTEAKSSVFKFEDYPHYFSSLSADHSNVTWSINPSFRPALRI